MKSGKVRQWVTGLNQPAQPGGKAYRRHSWVGPVCCCGQPLERTSRRRLISSARTPKMNRFSKPAVGRPGAQQPVAQCVLCTLNESS